MIYVSVSHLYVDHREHGNRIIHEMLTGSRLFQGIEIDLDEKK